MTSSIARRGSDRRLDAESEEFVARLTRAAYDVSLEQGIPGAFADFELRLWRELREVVRQRNAK